MLKERIEKIVSYIKQGLCGDEAAVSQLVRWLLEGLGWITHDPEDVKEQYPVDTGRVDFALLGKSNKPFVFIEVKRKGKADGVGEAQLFRYAFDHGAPILVLTDGAEWNFYLTGGRGRFHDRQFYKLSLVERDREVSANVLYRYLGRENVIEGKAEKAARQSLDDKTAKIEASKAIRRAWSDLLKAPNEALRDLLIAEAEIICGNKPEVEEVDQFLTGQANSAATPSVSSQESSPNVAAGRRKPKSSVPRLVGYEYRGRLKETKHANSVLEDVLNIFQNKNGTFLLRLKSRTDTEKRCLVAPQREDLYPESPHLVRYHSRQLKNGWWFSTAYSTVDIKRRIEIACEVAGVQFGSDLKLKFQER